MTLSFVPFLVIHVNAAYTRMTGVAAKDVLGKPFHDVFKDKRCKALAANVSSLFDLRDQLTSVHSRGQNKRCYCRLSVSVVGTEIGNEETDSPTHYMIGLEPVAQTGLPFTNHSVNTPLPHRGLHMEVTG